MSCTCKIRRYSDAAPTAWAWLGELSSAVMEPLDLAASGAQGRFAEEVGGKMERMVARQAPADRPAACISICVCPRPSPKWLLELHPFREGRKERKRDWADAWAQKGIEGILNNLSLPISKKLYFN